MPEYARVKDKDTGHVLSVPVSSVPHGNFEVLEEPAADVAGDPLPPKHFVRPTPNVPVEQERNGQKATNPKES